MADDPFRDLGRDHADPIAAAYARAHGAHPDLSEETFAEAIALGVRAWAAKLGTPPGLGEIRKDGVECLHVILPSGLMWSMILAIASDGRLPAQAGRGVGV